MAQRQILDMDLMVIGTEVRETRGGRVCEAAPISNLWGYQSDLLLNLPGLQVRYMENSLAFIEHNTVLSWGQRHLMADMALKMLNQVHQPATAKAS